MRPEPIDTTARHSARAWHGELQLVFRRQGDRTVLVTERACMPLAVQRPFYPEGAEPCHALVLHPPGGIAAGDRLTVGIEVGAQAQALVSAPAATKWYRSDGVGASQTVSICVKRGAQLEWLPPETIVFDGAEARNRLRVDLDRDATWLGWDITRFGRSARGETFRHGRWRAHTEIWRDGRPLWIDRQRLDGGSRLLTSAYGLAGAPVVATLVWIGAIVTPEIVQQARAAWNDATPGIAGVSRLAHGLVCRYRGPSSAQARAWLVRVWDLLRRTYRGRPACPPRIWDT